MHDLAMSLTNDTSMVERDVQQIYEFEKKISIVKRFQRSKI